MALAPADSRLLYEADQLARRCRLAPAQRLAALEPRMALVQERDALAAEVCDLLNQLGRPEEALELLRGRRWQPWEGGEGAARAQHERAHCALGRSALAEGRPDDATAHFEAALQCPEHLGEARHPLANDAELRLRLGDALAAAGRQVGSSCRLVRFPGWWSCGQGEVEAMQPNQQARACPPALQEEAEAQWEAAAAQRGDFQSMAVCPFSEATLPSALALRRLGREQVRPPGVWARGNLLAAAGWIVCSWAGSYISTPHAQHGSLVCHALAGGARAAGGAAGVRCRAGRAGG